MTTAMPPLQTQRLIIRPFVMDDLAAIYRILDVELAGSPVGSESLPSMAEREAWLRWTVLNYAQLAHLYQPPYGERAIVLGSTGQVVGAIGFVQSLGPWEQLPGLARGEPQPHQRFTPAFGLYWALSPAAQGQGYATEAARAMVGYAFGTLYLGRVIATTDYDNLASQAVMRRLGMRLLSNPFPDPPWFQVVGVLDYDDYAAGGELP
jgi:RimJ/RimL family protein N-acetyltransferase